jgi:hypothetical protein
MVCPLGIALRASFANAPRPSGFQPDAQTDYATGTGGSAGGSCPRDLLATNEALWLAELQRIEVVPAAGFAPAASSV